jgi:DNA-binding response OmpR family regulator
MTGRSLPVHNLVSAVVSSRGMSKVVLIIEDESAIAKLVAVTLRREGYAAVVAGDGEAGLKSFREAKPDFVILDLMMPKKNGIEVCKAIRETSQVPILMLTARRDEIDRVLGLEIGADDYLTKPFSVRELVARVRAILRRPAALEKPAEVRRGPLVLGDLEVSFEAYEVKVRGVAVPLTTKEFDLLRALYEGRDRVFGREELLEKVWGSAHAGELDTRTVDQHVARLRKKLGHEGARLVTVTNRGYRFKA